MPQPTKEKLISGDDLLDMGDIGPYELIDGRIIRMTPTGGEHGRIEGLLSRRNPPSGAVCDSDSVS